MNFIVHSIMYTYYAFRALRYRVPKIIAMVITSLQLVQMIIGCAVNYIAFSYKQNGMQCGVSDTNLKLSLLMYCSYFVLFARFFYNAYVSKSERKPVSQTKLTENDDVCKLQSNPVDKNSKKID